MFLSNARNQLQLLSNVAKYRRITALGHTTNKSSRLPVHNLHISNIISNNIKKNNLLQLQQQT